MQQGLAVCTRPRLATLSEVIAYHVISTLMTSSLTAHSSFMIKRLQCKQLSSCLNDIDAWMLANMLKLNSDKTQLLVTGPKQKVNPPIKGIHVADEYIGFSNNVRNRGLIFDSHVNLEKHIMNTRKTAFYHLRNIAKIRNCLSQDNAETLVHAFISSKLDFCNALLHDLPQSVIDRLQHVKNCAARLVTRT